MVYKHKIHYAWVILIMGTLVVFGALGLARFGYSIVLPSMQKSLNMNNTQAGILATANLIGYLILSLVGGALAAHYGPKLIITLGLMLTGWGMLLTGTVQNFFAAVFWRALTGIGSGASNVPAMGLISAWFGPKRRGLGAGIASSGSSVALIAIGPSVPYIMSIYGENGWRNSWYFFATATFILALLGFFILKNRPSEIGLRPLGATDKETTSNQTNSTTNWGLVYRSFSVWHLGLVYIAFGFSYIIYMTFFVKGLISEGNYTQASAGKLFMMMGWFSLLCGLIWGSVSDIIGRKYALAIVYLIHAVSFSLFALLPNKFGFTVSAILFGLSAWSIPAIMAATCGDILGSKLAPAALGFITLFFGIGQALGPFVAGRIADAYGSFLPAFLLAGVIALLGSIGSLTLSSSGRKQL
ncbi:TPA: MFS transporter [bacterium]|nr:MFS transporter [bacterium]